MFLNSTVWHCVQAIFSNQSTSSLVLAQVCSALPFVQYLTLSSVFLNLLCSTVYKLSFQSNLHRLWCLHSLCSTSICIISHLIICVSALYCVALYISYLSKSIYIIFGTCTGLCSTFICIISHLFHLCFCTVRCITVYKQAIFSNQFTSSLALAQVLAALPFVSYVTVSLNLYVYTVLCTSHLFISLYIIFATCKRLCST